MCWRIATIKGRYFCQVNRLAIESRWVGFLASWKWPKGWVVKRVWKTGLFQQSQRTKSSNQIIFGPSKLICDLWFVHILRKQIVCVPVVLSEEQLSRGDDLFYYPVPWIPPTKAFRKFMHATDWVWKSTKFQVINYFCPFLQGWFWKKHSKKNGCPPKETWQKTTRPAKIILKKQQNPSKSSTFQNFAFHLLGFSYPPRLACELSSGEVISLRGQTFDLCALCREVPLGTFHPTVQTDGFFFRPQHLGVFFGFPNPSGKRAWGSL